MARPERTRRIQGINIPELPLFHAGCGLAPEIGIQAWKIASGEVRNELLLDKILETKMPVLLSSGMSSWNELEQTVAKLKTESVPFLLMQCTSAYPCPPERVGLNLLREMRERFSCETGLSDHSGTIWPSLAAATLGAKAVEVHVTWDRTMFGPDAVASITFAELKELVNGIRLTERMLNSPVNKEAEAATLSKMRKMFGQSPSSHQKPFRWHPLRPEHLTSKKPEIGIPASEYQAGTGRKSD